MSHCAKGCNVTCEVIVQEVGSHCARSGRVVILPGRIIVQGSCII